MNDLVRHNDKTMNITQDGQYPDSQYALLAPLLQAIYADIQQRGFRWPKFEPQITQLPPDNPADAYALGIYDRMAFMWLRHVSPNGLVEMNFGSGGRQFGPTRLNQAMPIPEAYTALMSLLTVTWLTRVLNQVDLAPWNVAQIKAFYPEVVNNPLHSNVLRTFSHLVLELNEDLFSSTTNTVGVAYEPDGE
jgi:hypothetical protein